MEKIKIPPALIVISLIAVLVLYKSGFMASFITTCNNIEPDTTANFVTLLQSDLNLTTTSVGTQIVYAENISNSTVSYTFTGTTYKNKVALTLYDTSPISCERVINYLLKQEVNRKTAEFVSTLIRPDYNSSITYYTNTSTGYMTLSTAPIAGQVYFKLVNTSYVQMPVPYNSAAPTLAEDPYYFYSPIGYKTISGKIINSVAYWCSNNDHNLISTNENYYTAINIYGEGVIKCSTVWVNDTQKAKEQCDADNGIWNDVNITCKCKDGADYIPYVICSGERTSSSGSGESDTGTESEGTISDLTSDLKKVNTSTWIGVALAIGVIAFIIYDQFFKKKGKRRR